MRNNRILVGLVTVLLLAGFCCSYLYDKSPENAIRLKRFQRTLTSKELTASKQLERMKQIITHSSIDSLNHLSVASGDISYYVFQKNELLYWTDNSLAIGNLELSDATRPHYVLLPNAHCVSTALSFDSYKLVALIKIKNNYAYQNEELVNEFTPDFDLDKKVEIVVGEASDKHAVFCSHGEYLFSLSETRLPIYKEIYSQIGLVIYAMAFILLFFLLGRSAYFFNRKKISLQNFLLLITLSAILIGLCLYYNFPSILFLNKLFSPFQYASNPFLASIIHLSIATGFIFACIYCYYFHTKPPKTSKLRWVMQLTYILYFCLTYYVISGLVYHSSIQLSILRFHDFSLINIWIHFLILIWGIGLVLLFIRTHTDLRESGRIIRALSIDLILTTLLGIIYAMYFPEIAFKVVLSFLAICLSLYFPYFFREKKSIYFSIGLWCFVFTSFFVLNTIIIKNNQKFDKFKILAQNISINGNIDNDRMADILLEELDVKISGDKHLSRMITKTDSLSLANNYLNANYLRGFWNKYEMRLNAATLNSELYNEYEKYISESGTKLKQTHFYSVPANANNMSYIGEFKIKLPSEDSVALFMEFYPRRNYKSFSFPNLLIAASPDIQSNLNIGIAKYEHQRLVYASGKFDYPVSDNWLANQNTEFTKVVFKGNVHYIYQQSDDTYIVVTEQQPYDFMAYLLYFGYTFLAYFALCWVIVWIYQLTHRKRSYMLGLTAKFQYIFVGLLIISFLGIFYVSVDFIKNKYKEEQIDNLENKKTYIQKALQDMYYWNQDLNALNTQTLNFDLQDLSYIYHTDIHVYDNRGVLIGSSQPLIFNKNLISNRISPTAFQSESANLNQYEHIGKLNYLTGYTDFYNGDYLQIGYIAIPQFFSQSEIRNEIESFLAVIIHIYLVIIIVAVMLILIIGKQLSAPLKILENKLKSMHLGRRNEKIEYNMNDEIGQLVLQYNRTVDELEQSARLLAQSERESAWKSMARQVAHEINNPLTPMKLSIQQLQRTKTMNDDRFDDYFNKSTSMLIEQIDNLSRIAGTFSNFARMPEAKFERVDIAARLYSVVQLFTNNEHINIEFTGPVHRVYSYADPEQLVQVFNNIIKNAIQAIPIEREGQIDVNLELDERNIVIKVTDNGTGIDQGLHDKLFVPNFTTKSTGMGLGLAIAKNIIEQSGGTIHFSSLKNKGTTFTISLPLDSEV